MSKRVSGRNGELAARLREAVAEPLSNWRQVYEGFSPVDLTTGERRPRAPEPGEDYRRAAVLVPVFTVAGHNIWGATAAMTAGLLARLGWRAGGITHKIAVSNQHC